MIPSSRPGVIWKHFLDIGSLAQLVEHRTFNPMVEGSNPSRPTIISIGYKLYSDLSSCHGALMAQMMATKHNNTDTNCAKYQAS
jgi:hypothetical protein